MAMKNARVLYFVSIFFVVDLLIFSLINLTDPQRGSLLQTGDGLIWLCEVAWGDGDLTKPKLSVGHRLGYVVEDEVSRLKARISELEKLIAEWKAK